MDAEAEDELTKRVLLDPFGNSVLITVAFGGGAGVVIVQVAGLKYEKKNPDLKTFQLARKMYLLLGTKMVPKFLGMSMPLWLLGFDKFDMKSN